MQKLLELLNQYDDEEGKDLYEWEIEWEDIIWYNRFWWGYETIDVSKSVIISKRYWFIERLVKKWKLKDEPIFMRDDVLDQWFFQSWILGQVDRYTALLSIMENPVYALLDLLK